MFGQHLKAVFRYLDPLPSSIQKQKKKKRCQNWTPSDKTFGIRNVQTSRTVLAYKTGFCIFFSLQEPIFDVLVIFCFETRGVRVPR